jgi:hypothetical protein
MRGNWRGGRRANFAVVNKALLEQDAKAIFRRKWIEFTQ